MTHNLFSFFGKGYYSKKSGKWVPSTTPLQTVDVVWCAEYIPSVRAKYQTEELRRILPTASEQEVRDFKLREFDAVAVAGTFSYGSAQGLIERSKYIAVDIDDLSSTAEARKVQQTLVADPYVVTALCFLSPKGFGIKWWVESPEWCQDLPFAEQYRALSRHISFHYGLTADPTGVNVNRLCLLPYDPLCFINPKYCLTI